MSPSFPINLQGHQTLKGPENKSLLLPCSEFLLLCPKFQNSDFLLPSGWDRQVYGGAGGGAGGGSSVGQGVLQALAVPQSLSVGSLVPPPCWPSRPSRQQSHPLHLCSAPHHQVTPIFCWRVSLPIDQAQILSCFTDFQNLF